MPHAPSPARLLVALPLLACTAAPGDPWGAAPAPAATPDDPWGVGTPAAPAPAAPVTAAPVSPAPAAAPAPLAAAAGWVAPPSADRETRETWNTAGQLVRRLTFEQGQLQAETTFVYDAGGRVTDERTIGAGGSVVQSWSYNADGTTAVHAITADGALQLQEAYTYVDGKVVTRAVTTPSGTSITTTSYGVNGEPILVETRGADGSMLSRTVSDREAPLPERVKLSVGITGGVATSSDVKSTSVTAGFNINRKPTVAQYETDPVEFAAYGSYNRATSYEELTNDQLKAGIGFDYNNLVGPVTAFLFTNVERNPVANLDVDLLVAPIGVKYEIIPEGLFTLDASFAPLWNFRSIAVAAGGDCDGLTLSEDGHCTFSKIRGSLRVRAALNAGPLTLKDTIEFLPTLNPDGDFGAALEDEAIFRNTATLSVKLTTALTLSESVLFVRDPLLAAQVDCSAGADDNLLCDGMSLQTGTTLALSYAF